MARSAIVSAFTNYMMPFEMYRSGINLRVKEDI
jgi:hypothetical protein